MTTAVRPGNDNEIAILARILGDEDARLPEELARYILNAEFSARDKERMHELAVRNQEDLLTPAEREELDAFGRAGDLLSILKSKARRTLGLKLETRSPS